MDLGLELPGEAFFPRLKGVPVRFNVTGKQKDSEAKRENETS